MSNYAISLKRTSLLLLALTFTALLMVVNFASFFGNADAAQLSSRSLTLSSTLPGTEVGDGDAGDPENGSEATHTFAFTKSAAADAADRVSFTYCTNAIGACTTVPGLTLETVATLGASSNAGTLGSLATSDTNSDTTHDTVTLNSTGTFADGAVAVSIALENIDNPDEIPAFFVRIRLYANAAPGTTLDEGTVASAIVDGIEITARVAETLGFSTTGDFTGVVAPTSACVPVTGTGAIGLGDPTETTLAIDTAFDNYSAFRLYTNAANGVVVQYEGETLTKSDGDTITPVATEVLSDFGTEQFGLAVNLAAGGDAALAPNSRGATIDATNVSASADLTGGDPGELAINANYDEGAGNIQEGPSVAEFSFTAAAPTTIASSTGYVTCGTAAVRYLANIHPTTEAGTYTTTIVYSAVPTY